MTPLQTVGPAMLKSPLNTDWALRLDDFLERPEVGVALGEDVLKGALYAAALRDCGLRVRLLDFQRWLTPPGMVGSPIMIAAEAMKGLKGVLFTGGGDIDPELQGITHVHPSVGQVNAGRDVFEKLACDEALKMKIPIFGICRGMQLLNWTQGGTLYQDIDTEIVPHNQPKGHRQTDRNLEKSEIGHDMLIEPGSRMHQIFGTERIGVNSDHHQAVRTVAPNLRVSGRAPDGVVEAIEGTDPNHFIIGMQSHPELLFERDPIYLAPFKAFANAVHARAAADKAAESGR